MFIDTQIILGGEKMKNTKKSLIASGISLAVSVALLAGSTFAWFTDSVTNKGNKIQAGKLDVELWQKTESLSDAQKAEGLPYELEYTNISASTVPIFGYGRWEPGYSEGAALQVRNKGTLALKYELSFTGFTVTTGADNGGESSQDGNIAEVLDVYLLDTYRAPTEADTPVGTLSEFMADPAADTGVLAPGASSGDINIVVKMRKEAGNQYQNALVEFDIELRATQAAQEEDGFGNANYDVSADGTPNYPDWGTITTGKVIVPVAAEGATEFKDAEGVTTFSVPKEAIADGVEQLVLNITEEETVNSDVYVGEDQAAKTYDISIEGLKEDNTHEISVSFFIGTGLTGVEVYHYGNKIQNAEYDPETGIVKFTSTSFSPYTIIYSTVLTVKTEADFIAAIAQDGMKVTLGADITVNNADVKIPENVTTSIDLGGYTLTVNRNSAMINYGTIESLTNGSIIGGKYYGVYNQGHIGEINVNVKALGSDSMGAIYNQGSIGEISGGRYIGHSESAYASTITGSMGLYNSTYATVDLISGGYFQGSSASFRNYNKEGIKSVTGGFFDCPYMDENNRTFCDGGTITTLYYNYAPLSITGGTWYNAGTKLNSKLGEGCSMSQAEVCEMTSGKSYVRYDASTQTPAHWVDDENGTTYYYYNVVAVK